MKIAFIVLSIGLTTLSAPGAESTPSQGAPSIDSGPGIQFATLIHDFGRIKSGEPVKCDFVFTNTGQALLEVTAVQPQCGCTTTGDWSHKVEPGQTGVIPIQFNSGTSVGTIAKTITVTCNDRAHPTVSLQLKGTIWKPVEVSPQIATFNGTADALTSATSIVRIINNEDEPLTLSAPESSNPLFAAELTTKNPGREFELTVRLAGRLETQNAQGVIMLKTSSTNTPTLSINTLAILQPPLAATPKP